MRKFFGLLFIIHKILVDKFTFNGLDYVTIKKIDDDDGKK